MLHTAKVHEQQHVGHFAFVSKPADSGPDRFGIAKPDQILVNHFVIAQRANILGPRLEELIRLRPGFSLGQGKHHGKVVQKPLHALAGLFLGFFGRIAHVDKGVADPRQVGPAGLFHGRIKPSKQLLEVGQGGE